MRVTGSAVLLLVAAVLMISVSNAAATAAYAQTHDQQVTLSGDLQNDPVARDILEKIEKSKDWIAQLQKEIESLKQQQGLEEKRAVVLEHLNRDLKELDELWGYYTFDKRLERALNGTAAEFTDSIYDHPLKFTASKIDAGNAAMAIVIRGGGGPVEARAAFVDAAKISKVEMISVNVLYNVINGNAYYNQQTLFDADGQFNTELSGDLLRQYYQDYRADPSYLTANPLDIASWKELGKTDSHTECREDYILVYRDHTDDYICVTEYTAEMWQRHGMGNPVHREIQSAPDELSLVQLDRDRTVKKVLGINTKIQKIHEGYETQMGSIEKKYYFLFIKMNEAQREEERVVVDMLNNDEISNKNFSGQVTDIQEKYDEVKKDMNRDKIRILEIMKKNLKDDLGIFISEYEGISEIRITWDEKQNTYHATVKAKSQISS